MYREAFKMRRRALGMRHPHTLISMTELANLLTDKGKLGEAASLHREAFNVRRETLGPRHLDTLCSISCLAGVLH